LENILKSIALNGNDSQHMDEGHMMDGWWNFNFMSLWGLGLWLIFVVIAILVYRDAEKHGQNGLLWFVLIIIPFLGFLFLIMYLVVREANPAQPMSESSAMAIIEMRYARGEITRDEYHQMKTDVINDKIRTIK
jgi:putative membrane protein